MSPCLPCRYTECKRLQKHTRFKGEGLPRSFKANRMSLGWLRILVAGSWVLHAYRCFLRTTGQQGSNTQHLGSLEEMLGEEGLAKFTA